jgi:hypothetical protein
MYELQELVSKIIITKNAPKDLLSKWQERYKLNCQVVIKK